MQFVIDEDSPIFETLIPLRYEDVPKEFWNNIDWITRSYLHNYIDFSAIYNLKELLEHVLMMFHFLKLVDFKVYIYVKLEDGIELVFLREKVC